MNMRTPLGRVRGLGSARTGTEEFWLQRMTAIAGIPLTIAGLFLVISLTGRGFSAVKTILGSPLVAVLLILFIIANVIHMKIGVQVVIEDYVHEEWTKLASLILVRLLCFVLAASGIFAVLRLAFRG